ARWGADGAGAGDGRPAEDGGGGGRGEQRALGGRRDPALAGRRDEPDRHLRSQAGCAARDPRALRDDPDEAGGGPLLRPPAPAGGDGGQVLRPALHDARRPQPRLGGPPDANGLPADADGLLSQLWIGSRAGAGVPEVAAAVRLAAAAAGWLGVPRSP